MKRDRLARGWSVRELGARIKVNIGTLSQVETGRRPMTEALAAKCDDAFPERRGWYGQYYEESKSWTPASLRSWGEHEDKATSLRVWMPGISHGLLQTERYARTLLETSRGATAEVVAARLANRMARQQRVLYREDPPEAWFIVDEVALYRRVGSADVMAEQMQHLASVATRDNITVQVLPAVEHPANASGVIIADNAAYVEHLAGGLVYTEVETVSPLMKMFDNLRGECYRVSESSALFRRMTGIWMTGARALTAMPTAETA
jgi:transcriptional regulator with XRE-family HTH domain